MAYQERNLKFTLKDVRCFSGTQTFDIRPLTFLIGRNSTGKTTVMSCFSVIYNIISSKGRTYIPDFNMEPYSMGAFVNIISKHQKNSKIKNSHKNFEIGISNEKLNIKYSLQFVEKDKGAEPILNQLKANFENIDILCEKKNNKLFYTFTTDNKERCKIKSPFINDNMTIDPHILQFILVPNTTDKSSEQKILKEAFNKMYKHRKYFLEEIISLAPIRSKPQRTYNPIKESPSPEGEEIPVMLMRLKNQDSTWKKIHTRLMNFGKASGLFSNITVKKFGKTKGDPFQLQFQIRGTQSNIIDVGYGVSQILPLLVRLFISDIKKQRAIKRTRFLIQQPEVHLHPEAQAELGSLFVRSIKHNNSFLIETHSDYIVDRARMEVREGRIHPDQVSLIYLESTKKGVQAHNISIDKDGNLIGVPPGYRQFFIKETHRSLGFED